MDTRVPIHDLKRWIMEGEVAKADLAQVAAQPYGQELILDIHGVAMDKFTLPMIREFASKLCDELGMRKGPQHEWGEAKDLGNPEEKPKSNGLSLVQFLYSSSITIHAIDELGKVFINIFSCQPFDSQAAKAFCLTMFEGRLAKEHSIVRD